MPNLRTKHPYANFPHCSVLEGRSLCDPVVPGLARYVEKAATQRGSVTLSKDAALLVAACLRWVIDHQEVNRVIP